MIRAESIELVSSGQVPDDAGHAMVQDIELVIPLTGLIDVEAELEKLDREKSKIEKELQRVNGKLSNDKFLNNAPEAVVAKEKEKQDELTSRLAKNDESRQRLQKLS
jgi:valyl-tRNA synthetase